MPCTRLIACSRYTAPPTAHQRSPAGSMKPKRRRSRLRSTARGITLPHHASQQIRRGTPVGRKDLRPGDLVFFHRGRGIGHVGIYLGLDSEGHQRFLSSRKTANGPTLGDLGGRSILDGSGLYARACVTATAKAALASGLRVTVLRDAVACSSDASREAALRRLFRRGIEIAEAVPGQAS